MERQKEPGTQSSSFANVVPVLSSVAGYSLLWRLEMNIAQFFQDGTGAFSATRLVFVLWGLGSLITWISLSIHQKSLLALPDTVLTILGILMAGKVVQSFSPNDASPPKQ